MLLGSYAGKLDAEIRQIEYEEWEWIRLGERIADPVAGSKGVHCTPTV